MEKSTGRPVKKTLCEPVLLFQNSLTGGEINGRAPLMKTVFIGMHVRGFTKDVSSRIKEAGTFAGVQKKIPYLKKLGVTGIVLQPVYELDRKSVV